MTSDARGLEDLSQGHARAGDPKAADSISVLAALVEHQGSGHSYRRQSMSSSEEMVPGWSDDYAASTGMQRRPSLEASGARSDVNGGTMTSQVCAVCHDVAHGYYFGALVCLPCKTFFIRCMQRSHPAFRYRCRTDCDITSSGRTRCSYCRFQKCLSVGMRRKERPEVVVPTREEVLCAVCGDIANGVHFGVASCEGCKKFFRRSLSEYPTYVCSSTPRMCTMNPRMRTRCRYCRFQKCLDAGMSRFAVKRGRHSRKSWPKFQPKRSEVVGQQCLGDDCMDDSKARIKQQDPEEYGVFTTLEQTVSLTKDKPVKTVSSELLEELFYEEPSETDVSSSATAFFTAIGPVKDEEGSVDFTGVDHLLSNELLEKIFKTDDFCNEISVFSSASGCHDVEHGSGVRTKGGFDTTSCADEATSSTIMQHSFPLSPFSKTKQLCKRSFRQSSLSVSSPAEQHTVSTFVHCQALESAAVAVKGSSAQTMHEASEPATVPSNRIHYALVSQDTATDMQSAQQSVNNPEEPQQSYQCLPSRQQKSPKIGNCSITEAQQRTVCRSFSESDAASDQKPSDHDISRTCVHQSSEPWNDTKASNLQQRVYTSASAAWGEADQMCEVSEPGAVSTDGTSQALASHDTATDTQGVQELVDHIGRHHQNHPFPPRQQHQSPTISQCFTPEAQYKLFCRRFSESDAALDRYIREELSFDRYTSGRGFGRSLGSRNGIKTSYQPQQIEASVDKAQTGSATASEVFAPAAVQDDGNFPTRGSHDTATDMQGVQEAVDNTGGDHQNNPHPPRRLRKSSACLLSQSEQNGACEHRQRQQENHPDENPTTQCRFLLPMTVRDKTTSSIAPEVRSMSFHYRQERQKDEDALPCDNVSTSSVGGRHYLKNNPLFRTFSTENAGNDFISERVGLSKAKPRRQTIDNCCITEARQGSDNRSFSDSDHGVGKAMHFDHELPGNYFEQPSGHSVDLTYSFPWQQGCRLASRTQTNAARMFEVFDSPHVPLNETFRALVSRDSATNMQGAQDLVDDIQGFYQSSLILPRRQRISSTISDCFTTEAEERAVCRRFSESDGARDCVVGEKIYIDHDIFGNCSDQPSGPRNDTEVSDPVQRSYTSANRAQRGAATKSEELEPADIHSSGNLQGFVSHEVAIGTLGVQESAENTREHRQDHPFLSRRDYKSSACLFPQSAYHETHRQRPSKNHASVNATQWSQHPFLLAVGDKTTPFVAPKMPSMSSRYRQEGRHEKDGFCRRDGVSNCCLSGCQCPTNNVWFTTFSTGMACKSSACEHASPFQAKPRRQAVSKCFTTEAQQKTVCRRFSESDVALDHGAGVQTFFGGNTSGSCFDHALEFFIDIEHPDSLQQVYRPADGTQRDAAIMSGGCDPALVQANRYFQAPVSNDTATGTQSVHVDETGGYQHHHPFQSRTQHKSLAINDCFTTEAQQRFVCRRFSDSDAALSCSVGQKMRWNHDIFGSCFDQSFGPQNDNKHSDPLKVSDPLHMYTLANKAQVDVAFAQFNFSPSCKQRAVSTNDMSKPQQDLNQTSNTCITPKREKLG